MIKGIRFFDFTKEEDNPTWDGQWTNLYFINDGSKHYKSVKIFDTEKQAKDHGIFLQNGGTPGVKFITFLEPYTNQRIRLLKQENKILFHIQIPLTDKV